MSNAVNPYESPALPAEPKQPAPEASPATRIVVISVALCVIHACRHSFLAPTGEYWILPSFIADWLLLGTRAVYGALQGLGLAAIVLGGSRRQFNSFKAFRRWIRRLSPGDWLAIQTFSSLACATLAAIWSFRPDPSVGKAVDPILEYVLDFTLKSVLWILVLSWTREARIWRITVGLLLALQCVDPLRHQLFLWAPPNGWFEPWYWRVANGLSSPLFVAWVAFFAAGVVRDLRLGQPRDSLHWASIALTMAWPLGRILTNFAYQIGL